MRRLALALALVVLIVTINLKNLIALCFVCGQPTIRYLIPDDGGY
jgi:hypothetical protein